MKPGLYLGAEGHTYTPSDGHRVEPVMNKLVVVEVFTDGADKWVDPTQFKHVAPGRYVLWPEPVVKGDE